MADIIYLNFLKEVLNNGSRRDDRTGTGTLSVFGKQLSFDISKKFPLMTTKKTYWNGIVKELLWFLKGSTNAKSLHEDNVHIWDKNSSREYLDSVGLNDYPEYELGPIYGYQWRNWNSCGIDQMGKLISDLKSNPTSRRHIISAWNVEQIPKMALPPCHCFMQFYVDGDSLSCQMYQRSADVFLGLPFNIASYALLTYIIAKICKLKPDKLHICIGDAHLYLNHLDQAKQQLLNEPYESPTVTVSDISCIDSICYGDIVLHNYESHGKISAVMS
jgi:thymidylate synthase